MEYRDTWDLTTIPADLLMAEYQRRRGAMRSTFGGGRPKIMQECKHCGREFSVRELRLHTSACPKNPRNRDK
jgi:hypothetical protein